MIQGGAHILANGQAIATHRSQILQSFYNFRFRFSMPHHEARLGGDPGVEGFNRGQNLEGAIVFCPAPHFALQALNRFQVVVIAGRLGRHNRGNPLALGGLGLSYIPWSSPQVRR